MVCQLDPRLLVCGVVDKGLIGEAVLEALILLAPIARQSKEFVNCAQNSEYAIVKLTVVEFLDKTASLDSWSVLCLSTISMTVTSPTT